MFLDRFDFKLVKVDGKPCKPEESCTLVMWSSGKVERFSNGKPEDITKNDVVKFIADLGIFYSITPREFATAMDEQRAFVESKRDELASVEATRERLAQGG